MYFLQNNVFYILEVRGVQHFQSKGNWKAIFYGKGHIIVNFSLCCAEGHSVSNFQIILFQIVMSHYAINL